MIRRLVILAVGFVVFLGIPYLAGNWGWLFLSWLPALFSILYLDEE